MKFLLPVILGAWSLQCSAFELKKLPQEPLDVTLADHGFTGLEVPVDDLHSWHSLSKIEAMFVHEGLIYFLNNNSKEFYEVEHQLKIEELDEFDSNCKVIKVPYDNRTQKWGLLTKSSKRKNLQLFDRKGKLVSRKSLTRLFNSTDINLSTVEVKPDGKLVFLATTPSGSSEIIVMELLTGKNLVRASYNGDLHANKAYLCNSNPTYFGVDLGDKFEVKEPQVNGKLKTLFRIEYEKPGEYLSSLYPKGHYYMAEIRSIYSDKVYYVAHDPEASKEFQLSKFKQIPLNFGTMEKMDGIFQKVKSTMVEKPQWLPALGIELPYSTEGGEFIDDEELTFVLRNHEKVIFIDFKDFTHKEYKSSYEVHDVVKRGSRPSFYVVEDKQITLFDENYKKVDKKSSSHSLRGAAFFSDQMGLFVVTNTHVVHYHNGSIRYVAFSAPIEEGAPDIYRRGKSKVKVDSEVLTFQIEVRRDLYSVTLNLGTLKASWMPLQR